MIPPPYGLPYDGQNMALGNYPSPYTYAPGETGEEFTMDFGPSFQMDDYTTSLFSGMAGEDPSANLTQWPFMPPYTGMSEDGSTTSRAWLCFIYRRGNYLQPDSV
jgi:hypothetical protein